MEIYSIIRTGKVFNRLGMKVRISHFVTKNIPIDETTHSGTQLQHSSQVIHHREVKGSNSSKETLAKKIPESKKLRNQFKEEASYAVKPSRPVSELINKVKRDEVKKFRRISEISRKRPKKVIRYIKYGEIKENESTSTSVNN